MKIRIKLYFKKERKTKQAKMIKIFSQFEV